MILTSIYFCLPFYGPAAVWWDDSFDWNAANFTPLVMGVLLVAITIAWFGGMNKRYKGPIRTIEFDEGIGIKRPTSRSEPPAAAASRPPHRPRPRPDSSAAAAHERLPAFVLARAPVIVLLRLDRAVDRQQLSRLRERRDHA